jgi:hypothetical protein
MKQNTFSNKDIKNIDSEILNHLSNFDSKDNLGIFY